MNNPLPLPGCTPEPLMSYLKALGVFRLVAEQKDPTAKLSWANGTAALHTTLDRDGLARFFLDEYKPTPILAPWNGGSGFYGGGAAPLDAIAESGADRLARYRETIERIRRFIPKAKPKDDDKQSLLVECRSWLADEVTPWLDTCFALGEDGPGYFPLLGTGGNDGRLDFTNNFMQRVADVISFADGDTAPANSAEYLSAALFNDTLVSLDSAAVGQFNPGGIGGANGTQGKFEAGSRVNPWDFVLMIEGAMLFAGSVARRMGVAGPASAVFPFTVDSVAVGYGSATAGEETTDGSRRELWLPLWEAPATLPEARHLFAEGRAQIGRRQAKNAVEFAIAANLLGVSRGVTGFFRYGFLKRNGLAFLATPLGVQPVKLRPDARLLDDPPLVEWIERLRRATSDKDKTPARYQTALRHIDRTMFAFANRSEQGNDAPYLLDVLRAVGRAERTLAHGLRFSQEKYLRPLTGLSLDWLLQAKPGDEWRTFRLAASLASILATRGTDLGPLRVHLEPVEVSGEWVKWSPGSTSAVWSAQPLVHNLSAVLLRRGLESEQNALPGVSLRSRLFAPLADVVAFLQSDDANDEEFLDLFFGLIGLAWADADWFTANRDRIRTAFPESYPEVLPPEFAAVRLTTHEVKLVAASGKWRVAEHEEVPTITLKPDLRVHHRLARGSGRELAVAEAVEKAGRRLHADQLSNLFGPRRKLRSTLRTDPYRLAASCLFPLSRASLGRLVNSIVDSRSIPDEVPSEEIS